MAFCIPCTGGSVVRQGSIIVKTPSKDGVLGVYKTTFPNVEPNTFVEISGKPYDTRFDDVTYYGSSTGNY